MTEEYNEYGEIIIPKQVTPVYERKLDVGQQHRIHETKDLFEGDCYLCQQAAKKMQSYWGDDE